MNGFDMKTAGRNDTSNTAAPGQGLHPALSLALIATPIAWLLAEAVSPRLESSASAQLAVIAAHPTRWYWYTILLVLGSVTGVPAAIGLLQIATARMRRIGAIGGTLVALGFVGSIVDSANQLWSWQMALPGADRDQMAALQDRFDNAAGTNLIFAFTGIGLMVGTVLLTIALARSSEVPAWAAITFAVAVFTNVLSLSANSVPAVAASCALLLASMGWIGLTMFRRRSAPARGPLPAGKAAAA